MKNSVFTETTELTEINRNLPVRFALFLLVPPALILKPLLPAWAFMWVLALALFFGCKWIVLWDEISKSDWRHTFLFLFAYPGMNAPRFFKAVPAAKVEPKMLGSAVVNIVLGISLLCFLLPMLAGNAESQAWIGMIGIIFLLHFGIFQLSVALLRAQGFDAPRMMNKPIVACSLAEFWSKRWNTDFHFLTNKFLFRPLVKRLGARGALVSGFLVSGAVHELVITFPAGGGYGGPLAYFTVQAFGLLLERKLRDQGFLNSKFSGWTWMAAFTILPTPLLFPLEFRERIVLPMLNSIGVL